MRLSSALAILLICAPHGASTWPAWKGQKPEKGNPGTRGGGGPQTGHGGPPGKSGTRGGGSPTGGGSAERAKEERAEVKEIINDEVAEAARLEKAAAAIAKVEAEEASDAIDALEDKSGGRPEWAGTKGGDPGKIKTKENGSFSGPSKPFGAGLGAKSAGSISGPKGPAGRVWTWHQERWTVRSHHL